MRISISSQEKRALVFRCLGYIVPFLTLPFFVRQIPTADYGRLGVALTICGVLSAICEGGANIGGAKRLALAKTLAERSVVSAGIYLHKLSLLLICLIGGALYSSVLMQSSADLLLFATCFCFVVVPDALTPTWVFYSKGAVDELTSRLFLSRMLSLGPALFLVWMLPNSLAAAIATGLPFLVFAAVVRGRARELQPVFTTKLSNAAQLWRVRAQPWRVTAQPLMHLGSLTALTFPAIVMQALAWSNRGNMGSAYLTISLWVALRQLCIIPNQAAFHLAIAPSVQKELLREKLRNAMVFGCVLALLAGVFILAVGEPLLRLAFGPQYAQLNNVLMPLFGSVAMFVVGHGIALNRLAACGRNRDFFLSYFLSLCAFIGVFVGLEGHDADNRLVWSIVAADLGLLLSASAFSALMRPTARTGKAL